MADAPLRARWTRVQAKLARLRSAIAAWAVWTMLTNAGSEPAASSDAANDILRARPAK
ncbi:MAG: hypothetical protein ACLPVY_06715 [Acidimicrobiia bacterium]